MFWITITGSVPTTERLQMAHDSSLYGNTRSEIAKKGYSVNNNGQVVNSWGRPVYTGMYSNDTYSVSHGHTAGTSSS